jgi:uncharacterized delta-60 repeat protein
VVFLALVALALGAGVASAGDADDLDPDFGIDGKTVTDLGGYDIAISMALDPDGKIVAVGYSDVDMAVMRWDSDGAPDDTFGEDGVVTIGFPGQDGSFAQDVAIQADGKIVVSGSAYDANGYSFVAARLETDGDLDTGFDGDGRVLTSLGSGTNDLGVGDVIQADGKIVLCGRVSAGPGQNDFGLVRYNADGSLDTGFSGDGKLVQDIGSKFDIAFDPGVTSDGKIIAVGRSGDDFAITRYASDGTPDTGFDADGIAKVNFGDFSHPYAVAVQPNDRIVAAGFAKMGSNYDFAVTRVKTDGSLDDSFSGDGRATVDFGNDDAEVGNVALTASGDIVLAGDTLGDLYGTFAVAELGSDGALLGKLRSRFPGTIGAFASGVAVQPGDGYIVVSGGASPSASTADFAVARYTGIADDEPPETVVDSTPALYGTDATPTFTFSSPDDPSATFECRLMSGPDFEPCESPYTFAELPDGGYTFSVRAVGANGEADSFPPEKPFIIDTHAPDTEITSIHTRRGSRKATARFAGTDPNPGSRPLIYQCSLDGADLESCSSPLHLTGLNRGRHHLTVIAQDRAGNQDVTPASRSFKVRGKRH